MQTIDNLMKTFLADECSMTLQMNMEFFKGHSNGFHQFYCMNLSKKKCTLGTKIFLTLPFQKSIRIELRTLERTLAIAERNDRVGDQERYGIVVNRTNAQSSEGRRGELGETTGEFCNGHNRKMTKANK